MEKTKIDTKTGIKVTVHIPDDIPENLRQQRINLLYDLLKPKEKNNEREKNTA